MRAPYPPNARCWLCRRRRRAGPSFGVVVLSRPPRCALALWRPRSLCGRGLLFCRGGRVSRPLPAAELGALAWAGSVSCCTVLFAARYVMPSRLRTRFVASPTHANPKARRRLAGRAAPRSARRRGGPRAIHAPLRAAHGPRRVRAPHAHIKPSPSPPGGAAAHPAASASQPLSHVGLPNTDAAPLQLCPARAGRRRLYQNAQFQEAARARWPGGRALVSVSERHAGRPQPTAGVERFDRSTGRPGPSGHRIAAAPGAGASAAASSRGADACCADVTLCRRTGARRGGAASITTRPSRGAGWCRWRAQSRSTCHVPLKPARDCFCLHIEYAYTHVRRVSLSPGYLEIRPEGPVMLGARTHASLVPKQAARLMCGSPAHRPAPRAARRRPRAAARAAQPAGAAGAPVPSGAGPSQPTPPQRLEGGPATSSSSQAAAGGGRFARILALVERHGAGAGGCRAAHGRGRCRRGAPHQCQRRVPPWRSATWLTRAHTAHPQTPPSAVLPVPFQSRVCLRPGRVVGAVRARNGAEPARAGRVAQVCARLRAHLLHRCAAWGAARRGGSAWSLARFASHACMPFVSGNSLCVARRLNAWQAMTWHGMARHRMQGIRPGARARSPAQPRPASRLAPLLTRSPRGAARQARRRPGARAARRRAAVGAAGAPARQPPARARGRARRRGGAAAVPAGRGRGAFRRRAVTACPLAGGGQLALQLGGRPHLWGPRCFASDVFCRPTPLVAPASPSLRSSAGAAHRLHNSPAATRFIRITYAASVNAFACGPGKRSGRC